jgi:ribosomal protein L11 methyltransferase
MEWVEVSLPAGALADEVAALVATSDEVAAGGVEVRGEEIVLWAPVAEAEAAAEGLRAAARRLAEAGFEVDPSTVRVRPAAPEDDWRDAWKKYFKVARVTSRIVIVPSWTTHQAEPGDVVLDLDPGRAFGTGAHASTRLCLRELDDLAAEGHHVTRFLDVGTGSGILSIAAAKLWPQARGVAIDVDPLACSAAEENLARNGQAERVRVADDAVDAVDGAFELVVANIQADVLDALKEPLAARVAAGGALILSGLLAHQALPTADLYARLGFRVERSGALDDDPEWASLRLRR